MIDTGSGERISRHRIDTLRRNDYQITTTNCCGGGGHGPVAMRSVATVYALSHARVEIICESGRYAASQSEPRKAIEVDAIGDTSKHLRPYRQVDPW